MIPRVPPSDVPTERAVLGAVMLRPETIDDLVEILAPSDWYEERHATLWRGLVWMRTHGRPIDVTTLTALLTQHGHLEDVGGVAYISGLLDACPTAANVTAHAEIVRDLARVRAGLRVCIEYQERIYGEERGTADDLLSCMVRDVETAASDRERSRLRSLSDLLPEVVGELQRLHREKIDPGVPTGIAGLDRLLGGLQPGDLYVIAARPSMGKTALAMSIAVEAAARKFPSLVYSIEMESEALVRRLLSMEARVESQRMRVPRLLDSGDWDRITEASRTLASLPVWIDDTSEVKVPQIRARARRLARKHGLRLVMIDYLQIVGEQEGRKGRRDETRERAVAANVAGLKSMAKELDVPVVLLAQLNRDCEKRQDKRPILADGRESGALEQDADTVLMLYREAQYVPDCGHDDVEILVRKNRNGPLGTVVVSYRKEFMRFEEQAQGPAPGGRETRVDGDREGEYWP